MTFQQAPYESRAPRAASASSPLRSPNVLTPINVLAMRLGVTSRALRHYEAIGLVSSGRGSRGVRRYDQDTVAVLEAITLLRGVDVPIADIRAVMTQRFDAKSYAQALRGVLADALLERRRCADAIEALMADIESTFTPASAEDA